MGFVIKPINWVRMATSDESAGVCVCVCVHCAGSGYECSRVVEEDCNDVAGLCDVNAQCLYDASVRRYSCRCNRGFEGDGRHCSRVGKLFSTHTYASTNYSNIPHIA